MKTKYIDMPRLAQKLQARFRPVFGSLDVNDSDKQIISLGFNIPDKKLGYPEEILNYTVSLCGNWRFIHLTDYEKIKAGKDDSMAQFKKFFLDPREDRYKYGQNLDGFFNFPTARKLSARGLNPYDGIKNLFLSATSHDSSVLPLVNFRSPDYFGKPILIRREVHNEHISCHAYVWVRDREGARFVDLQFYKIVPSTIW